MGAMEFLRKARVSVYSWGLIATKTGVNQSAEERNAAGKVSLIIPVFDGANVLGRCLASIERYASEAEVILVNDGSRLPETRSILEEFALRNDWRLLHNSTRQGHSRSTEAGCGLASRPYLCLLNADTLVTPHCWLDAVRAFESDSRIAVTGPCTSHASTVQLLRRAEVCRHHWTDEQVLTFARKLESKRPAQINLPDIGGFAMFIRRETWQQMGGFDANLPDYGNEVELCKRIVKAGWKIVWTRTSYIHHFGGQGYSQLGENFIAQNCRDAQIYIDRLHTVEHQDQEHLALQATRPKTVRPLRPPDEALD